MTKTYSIVIEIEVDDEDGLSDFPSLSELNDETKRFIKDHFAADVDIIEVAEGSLESEFGVTFDE